MKVLLIVYKMKPGKGSEDGIGYHLSAALVEKLLHVSIVTRKENIFALQQDPAFAKACLIPFDLPMWLNLFKKGRFGVGFYYYLWQASVGRFVKSLMSGDDFDVIHQINFGMTWVPHFIRPVKAKVFWGPLMNHGHIPHDFLFHSKMKYFFLEKSTSFLKHVMWSCDPFLKKALRCTTGVFYGSPSIPNVFRSHIKPEHVILPAGSAFIMPSIKKTGEKFVVLYVGRFVDLKGCLPSLRAFRDFVLRLPPEDQRKTELIMIGQGVLREKLQKEASIINRETQAKCAIVNWQEQRDLPLYYKEASLFIFPSFEGQGLVVAEALAHGCPVLCLENTGAERVASYAACAVKVGRYGDVHKDLVEQLARLAHMYRNQPNSYRVLIENAQRRSQDLCWKRKADQIIGAYHA